MQRMYINENEFTEEKEPIVEVHELESKTAPISKILLYTVLASFVMYGLKINGTI